MLQNFCHVLFLQQHPHVNISSIGAPLKDAFILIYNRFHNILKLFDDLPNFFTKLN